MKQILAISLLALLISAVLPKKNPEIRESFPLLWKTEFGLTSHRTVPVLQNGILIMGSNGNHYNDYAIDENSGVHMLKLANGKRIRSFANEIYGDMDVNGILEYKSDLIFGNDNDELLCYTNKGAKKWRAALIGDVESKPTLIQIGDRTAVVVGTEAGVLAAFDVSTGIRIWMVAATEDAKKMLEKSRSIVKINMYAHAGEMFFLPPVVADFDQDGIDDLLYSCFDEVQAYSGKDGKLLWEMNEKTHPKLQLPAWRRTPMLIGKGSDLRLVCTAIDRVGLTDSLTHNKLIWINRFGKIVDTYNFEHFEQPVLNQTGDVFVTSNCIIHPGKNASELKRIPFENTFPDKTYTFSRFTDGQLASNMITVNGEKCVVACFQFDYGTVSPCITVIGTKTGKFHLYSKLQKGSEFMPLLTDVNKDGKLDVLVGCYDKMLYCFTLGIPTTNLK